MGVKKEREVKGEVKEMKKEEKKDRIMMRKVDIDGEEWRIIGLYVNGDMERKMKRLKKWIKGGRTERVTIGGAFNARTEVWEGRINSESKEDR